MNQVIYGEECAHPDIAASLSDLGLPYHQTLRKNKLDIDISDLDADGYNYQVRIIRSDLSSNITRLRILSGRIFR